MGRTAKCLQLATSLGLQFSSDALSAVACPPLGCCRLYAAPESQLTRVPSHFCPLPPLLYLFGQKLRGAWLARSFDLLGSELELFWKCPTAYLCISGGSRLILALDSITSFATRPLSSGKIKK